MDTHYLQVGNVYTKGYLLGDTQVTGALQDSGPNYSETYLSVIVPVYNGGSLFQRCLESLADSSHRNWELIVVDDGSTDDSVSVAKDYGARILSTNGRLGPGAARNLGAQYANAEIICFIDADCEAHQDTLSNIARAFAERPYADALFGSYDEQPGAQTFISQYKNLAHRYVHQMGSEIASTFWAGCGALKRRVFLSIGGFDTKRFPRPMIEDIELGYRLKRSGGTIINAKDVEVKHHKKWTLTGLVKTDVCDRGIPWMRLILNDKSKLVNDLNLQVKDRLSVISTYLMCLALLIAPFVPQVLLAIPVLAVLLISMHLPFYRYFFDLRGLGFAVGVIMMHWLYFLYCGVASIGGILLHLRDQMNQEETSICAPLRSFTPFDEKASV